MKDSKYDLIFTPHKQKEVIFDQKRKLHFCKRKQILKTSFSRTRNAVSESDSRTIQKLENLRDLLHDTNEPVDNQG